MYSSTSSIMSWFATFYMLVAPTAPEKSGVEYFGRIDLAFSSCVLDPWRLLIYCNSGFSLMTCCLILCLDCYFPILLMFLGEMLPPSSSSLLGPHLLTERARFWLVLRMFLIQLSSVPNMPPREPKDSLAFCFSYISLSLAMCAISWFSLSISFCFRLYFSLYLLLLEG